MSLIELVIYAAIAAAVAFGAHEAWDGFKDKIGAPYAQKQQAADQVVVDSLTKRATMAEQAEKDRESENKTLADKLDTQSQATKAKALLDAQAQAKTAAILTALGSQIAGANTEIGRLSTIANAQPTQESCEDELADTNAVLDSIIAGRLRH